MQIYALLPLPALLTGDCPPLPVLCSQPCPPCCCRCSCRRTHAGRGCADVSASADWCSVVGACYLLNFCRRARLLLIAVSK
jgi:hypothetical protein